MRELLYPLKLLVLALLLLAGGRAAADPPPDKLAGLLDIPRARPDAKDDELRKLLKERFNTAVVEMQSLYQSFQAGQGTTIVAVQDASRRVLQSGLELSSERRDRIELLSRYVEITKEIERMTETAVKAGARSPTDLHRTRYLRLDAEIQLLRARREPDKTKPK